MSLFKQEFVDLEVDLNAHILSGNSAGVQEILLPFLDESVRLAEDCARQKNISRLRECVHRVCTYLDECCGLWSDFLKISKRGDDAHQPRLVAMAMASLPQNAILILNRLGTLAFRADLFDYALQIFGRLFSDGSLTDANGLSFTETLIRLEKFQQAEVTGTQLVVTLTQKLNQSFESPSTVTSSALPGTTKTIAAVNASLLSMAYGNLAIAQIALERPRAIVSETYAKALQIAEAGLGAAHPITRQTREEIAVFNATATTRTNEPKVATESSFLPPIGNSSTGKTVKQSHEHEAASITPADQKSIASTVSLPPLVPRPPNMAASSSSAAHLSQAPSSTMGVNDLEALLPSPQAFFAPKPPASGGNDGKDHPPPTKRRPTPDSLFQSPLRPAFPPTAMLPPPPPSTTNEQSSGGGATKLEVQSESGIQTEERDSDDERKAGVAAESDSSDAKNGPQHQGVGEESAMERKEDAPEEANTEAATTHYEPSANSTSSVLASASTTTANTKIQLTTTSLIPRPPPTQAQKLSLLEAEMELKARQAIIEEEAQWREQMEAVQRLGRWDELGSPAKKIPAKLHRGYYYCRQLLVFHHERWERQSIFLEHSKALVQSKEWLTRRVLMQLQVTAFQGLVNQFTLSTKRLVEMLMEHVKQQSQLIREEVNARGLIGAAQLQTRSAFPGVWTLGLMEVPRKELMSVELRGRIQVASLELKQRHGLQLQRCEERERVGRSKLAKLEVQELEALKEMEEASRKVADLREIDRHAIQGLMAVAMGQASAIIKNEATVRQFLVTDFGHTVARLTLCQDERVARAAVLHEYQLVNEQLEVRAVRPVHQWIRQAQYSMLQLEQSEFHARIELASLESQYRLVIDTLALSRVESVGRRALWAEMMQHDLTVHHEFQQGWLKISACETEWRGVETEERSGRMEILGEELGSRTFFTELFRSEHQISRVIDCEAQEHLTRKRILDQQTMEWTQSIQMYGQRLQNHWSFTTGMAQHLETKENEARRWIEGQYQEGLVALWKAEIPTAILNPSHLTPKRPLPFFSLNESARDFRAAVADICTV